MNEPIVISHLGELSTLVSSETGLLAYFSTPDCRVCQALRPKVWKMLHREFPRILPVYVDCAATPETAAHYQVFTVPTLLAFFEGREWLRAGRNLGLEELRQGLARPYGLCFGKE